MEAQQFTALIDHEMEFEAIKPPFGGASSPRETFKDLVSIDPLGMTDCDRSAINKGDSSAGATQTQSEGHQRNRNTWDELNEATIAHQTRKELSELGETGQIKGFEITKAHLVIGDDDRGKFTQGQRACSVSSFAAISQKK